jgi:hypothetical protein
MVFGSLQTTSAEYGTTDRRWLRDVHGLDDTLGVTLDGSLFPPADFPDGTVPSGVLLGQVTATRLWGPYSNAATDGRQTARGHLAAHRVVAPGVRVQAAVMDHGAVIRNYLPTAAGLDAAAEAELTRIRYTTTPDGA